MKHAPGEPLTDHEIKQLYKLFRKWSDITAPPVDGGRNPELIHSPEVLGILGVVTKWIKWHAEERSLDL